MYKLESPAGRSVLINGKEHLFFSGYSYLGMSHVQEFTDLVKAGIDHYGLLHPSARISNTALNVYTELEEQLSALTGQEKTISFSSGYLAGRAVAEMFISDKEAIILAGTHPVLKGNQKVFTGTTEELVAVVNTINDDNITIVADSINPLNATINNFYFLKHINRNKHITCIVDNSHGIGLIGKDGIGITAGLPTQPNITYIITYSLSKAFHINGGAISSEAKIIEQLATSPFFTSSTPIAPSFAYAFTKGKHLYNRQHKKLQQNIQYFIDLIKDINGIQHHPELPIFVLPETFNEIFFDAHHIIISSFSYPDPAGKKINRVILSALHSQSDLKALASALKEGNKMLG